MKYKKKGVSYQTHVYIHRMLQQTTAENHVS